MELDGSKEIDPKIRSFLERRGAIIKQEGGYITLTGKFSFTASEVDEEIFGVIPTPVLPDQKKSMFSYLFGSLYSGLSSILGGNMFNFGIGVSGNSYQKIANWNNYSIVSSLGSANITSQHWNNRGIFLSYGLTVINAQKISNNETWFHKFIYNAYYKFWGGVRGVSNIVSGAAWSAMKWVTGYSSKSLESPVENTLISKETHTHESNDTLFTQVLSNVMLLFCSLAERRSNTYGVPEMHVPRVIPTNRPRTFD